MSDTHSLNETARLGLSSATDITSILGSASAWRFHVVASVDDAWEGAKLLFPQESVIFCTKCIFIAAYSRDVRIMNGSCRNV
jgi:hypothetical protein